MSFPTQTQEYPWRQPSYETADPVDLALFGEVVCAPLGYIVLGRGGDKASDCNNGFFVRYDDEWSRLAEKIIELLGAEGSRLQRLLNV